MMKYIRFREHGFVLFDGDECHERMARTVGGTPLSAGMVFWDGEGPLCTGESLTLNLKSDSEDTTRLRAAFNMVK